MKYPVILKYVYSYISSGNYYKVVERQYFQLFEGIKTSKMLSLGSVTNVKVELENYDNEEINFTFKFSKYAKPDTFNKEIEFIENSYSLKRGETVSIICVEMYWAYARGGENGPAKLEVTWINYDELMEDVMSQVESEPNKSSKLANFLLEEGLYDSAYNMLIKSGAKSYQLGLCYEKGYGTQIDINSAVDIYLTVSGYDANSGLERIVNSTSLRTLFTENTSEFVKYDDIKKTILLEKFARYKEAYGSAKIPTSLDDNTLENLRRNVELKVISFLELGRPSNDPYTCNSSKDHTMHHLALYYDMLNNIPVEEQKKYYVVETEDDPYDGGTNDYHIVYDDLIIETLQKEALKNDVIALGCLAVQYTINPQKSSYRLENVNEIIQRLLYVAENGDAKDSGMAYYFLGRYYEISVELNELLCRPFNEENMSIANKYFKLALEKDFHMAIVHLFDDIINENSKEEALRILEAHAKYVPYIGRYSKPNKFHNKLEELRE